MHVQRSLRLSGESRLEALGDGFPERGREEVVRQYARLMARAAKATAHTPTQESSDEDSAR